MRGEPVMAEPGKEGPPSMTADEAEAYSWAKKQDYQSVAARYARSLAGFIERDEKRRVALEIKVKVRDIRIIKMTTALTRLKKEYAPDEEGCDYCDVNDVHNCLPNCPWRQAAEIIHFSDDELLDALTPAPKEGRPNYDAQRKYLNSTVNSAWDKRRIAWLESIRKECLALGVEKIYPEFGRLLSQVEFCAPAPQEDTQK